MSKNERLQEYFEFTEDDLRENRRGELTAEQRSIIKGRMWKEINRVLIIVLGILFIVFIVVPAFPTESRNTSNPTVAVILTLMTAVFLVFRALTKNDLALHEVKGKVRFIRTVVVGGGMRERTNTELKVDGRVFKVREDLMDILDQGDICHFFYTGGGDIVSAEFLDNPETD